MICKDCELEVQKLNRKGICLSCAHREYNSKWAGEEYVPIRELKGTPGYKIAIARRIKVGSAKMPTETKTLTSIPSIKETIAKEATKELSKLFPSNDNQKQVTVETMKKVEETKDLTENDFKEKCYNMVLNDARQAFKAENLDLNFFKNIDVKSFINTFTEILYNEDMYEDSRKAQEIFNSLSIDYVHNLKDVEWDFESLKLAGGLEKALVELRAPNQNFIYNYGVLKDLFDYLRNDPKFMNLLNLTKRRIENNEPKVYGARASEDERYKLMTKKLDDLYGDYSKDYMIKVINIQLDILYQIWEEK